ncbi:hypothetical protein [Roseivirga pacifica]|uniref:hypothetical protein n=1 Tax=Roseivirga pacifica TaxID=1267423 RepID=UPI002095194E|nr:hypothetical protein [Roseivirga pacifica]MCO6358935.1 hypothetical protein [Roseivirga pacifica]MCO6365429.1 hypothetical protein [Roseivirga pacifica]MCO6371841.1 hypothetical protein [Roseivirga pacifica]MCO6376048.1 hypothetical protein [Roseivirga pacifica]MCO6379219.1 hypothetical protein [Roseivirga pacifica]
MRKIIVMMVLSLVATSFYGQGLNQKDRQQIDQRVGSFLRQISDKNYTGLVDYIYPRVFEHTSKDQMFKTFAMLEQMGITLKFQNMEVLEANALSTVDNIEYAMIKYNLDMTLPLTTDDLKGFAPLIVPSLESNFGKGNVIYNKAENYIRVKGQKYLMGVKDPEYKSQWLFLIYDASFKSAITKIVPPKVNQQAAAIAGE